MRIRNSRYLVSIMAVMTLLIAACAAPQTATFEPRPTTAATEAAEATEETVAEATEETVAEATEETVAEATEEAVAEATEETVAEATEETIAEATEETVAEATEEAVAEATEEAVAEATEEAVAEATEETVAEATEETVAEATEEAVAEATEETVAEATEEAVAEATEEAVAEATEVPDTLLFEDAYSFEYPSEWELQPSLTTDQVRLTLDNQTIIVAGPAAYAQTLGNTTFDTDSEELAFYLDRTGYTVGDELDVSAGIATYSIALPRRNQVGSGTLIDLENGRQGVLIALGAEDGELPTDVTNEILSTIDYPQDLVDVAVNADGFETLVAAVQAAGLEADLRSGAITVFAPTDEAFAALLESLELTAEELLADTDLLTTVLTYHVVDGVFLAEDVIGLDGEAVATLQGGEITVNISDEGGVTLTDANGNVVNVIATDIEGSNGVIHVIDGVLLPIIEEEEPEATPEVTAEATAEATESADAATPEATAEATESADAATPEATENIMSLAVNTPDLSTLAAAVVRANLIADLSVGADVTVFAPTNDAFAATLEELGIGLDDLVADTDLLTSILTYHVVPGAIFSGDLSAGEVETLNGATVTISFGEDGAVLVNGATVILADIAATNGVVHVIDSVLLPPSDE